MKLYIETTVPNFLFADDAPEKKAITHSSLTGVEPARMSFLFRN
jgi:hypothetical protein